MYQFKYISQNKFLISFSLLGHLYYLTNQFLSFDSTTKSLLLK